MSRASSRFCTHVRSQFSLKKVSRDSGFIGLAFAVRKDSKELREALDAVLKEMWADGSLNKIKQAYVDPLDRAGHIPVIAQQLSLDQQSCDDLIV